MTALAPTASAQGDLPGNPNRGIPQEPIPSNSKTLGSDMPTAFEVASVRPGVYGHLGGKGYTVDGINFQGSTLLLLIMDAYHVEDPQAVVGVPDWCRTTAYDINAKVAETDIPQWRKNASMRSPNSAFQQLLRDRFGLQAHWENRESNVYELVVDKRGPKFTEAKVGYDYPDGIKGRDGTPRIGLSKSEGHLVGQGATMAALAQYLQPLVGRPVVEKTNLTGKYDFILDIPANTTMDELTPMLFSLVRESLGLRLEPAKAPVQSLVIDHVERPSAN